MNFTLHNIKSKLNFSQKPGWAAQMEMSPPYRQELMDKAGFDIKNPKIAAVLILIYEEKGKLQFPVILRNTYPGVHSNQIGFPGGKVETKDENLEETAKRETQEEIGANAEKIEILGALTELFIPPSNFLVYPFVGIYNDLPRFSPCDHEVQEIIPMELENFIQKSNVIAYNVTHKGQSADVPAYQLPDGKIVWGATAMMLNEFSVFIKESLNL